MDMSLIASPLAGSQIHGIHCIMIACIMCYSNNYDHKNDELLPRKCMTSYLEIASYL